MMSPNPPLQGSLAVSLSNISQFLPSEPLENSYLGPSFCAPPARFTSDHNGFGSSWFWPKRFYPFTAIILKSGGTRLYRALFSPISLSANLPRFKPNLTGQSNNPPFTDSCLRFEIFWHVWVTFLVIRISYQNFYHNMQLRIHWVSNLHSRECGPLITNHRLVSI